MHMQLRCKGCLHGILIQHKPAELSHGEGANTLNKIWWTNSRSQLTILTKITHIH